MTFKTVGLLLVVGATGAVTLGCGGDESSSTSGGNTGSSSSGSSSSGMSSSSSSGGSCTNACTPVGSYRCNGETVESCAPGMDGCLNWVALLDCAANGKVCDDGVSPAVCADPGGPTCSDGAKNQDETDVDCGGATCNACALGQACTQNSDCVSNVCDPGSNTCAAAPTCSDNVKNGTETDVDCGGGCPPCAVGGACMQNGDCVTNVCNPATQTCSAMPTCMDGIKNQNETDIDCGGMCGPCAVGQDCTTNADCSSGNCDPATKTCVAMATCMDGIKNQNETDIDCGGVCPDCNVGQTCTMNSDCMSNTCNTGGTNTCVPAGTPTCNDAAKNQDETDIDCGGAVCGPCAIGEGCKQASDCITNICDFISTKTCIDATPSFQIDEDFETGDYSLFPYTHAGPHPWIIETDPAKCHGGMSCSRTSPLHALNETSSYEVSLSVRQNTTVSFWAKTNTEPGQHFLRFYVDGVQQMEISGQNDWMLYTFNVMATGPNGPNRILKWEYARSGFVDPNHPPWNEVWVDDIDMPNWNTDPSVPEHLRPWNGKLTTDTKPTFQWQSFDPDFDPITYQMEWDTNPNFSNPSTTGEIQQTQFSPMMPLNDNTIYYWRVRAKDNSNYRWSAWSSPWAVEINTAHEYAAEWRQSKAPQFSMNTTTSLAINPDNVTALSGSGSKNGSAGLNAGGGTSTVVLSGFVPPPPGTSGTLTINGSGDFNGGLGGNEYGTVFIDGTNVGTYNPGVCVGSAVFNIADVSGFLADGTANIAFQTGSGVNIAGCGGTTDTFSATLSFNYTTTGTMISVPINFNLFDNKKYWEKIQVVGTGTISIQVLDAMGNLIPEMAVPGNAAGLTSRTIRLWDLNPVTYPEIRLKATLSPGSVLDEWSVIGNDVFEWLFSNNGDLEGWVANDKNAVATAAVSGGVIKFNGLAAGTDPNIQYMFPQPIDATRFTTIEVRVRTSNNNQNDMPTVLWDSNYGSWDANRSIAYPPTFLFAFQDLSYDLTIVPMMPKEPWQGLINGIRVDPVVQFLDVLNMPADGWFEIDRIAIY